MYGKPSYLGGYLGGLSEESPHYYRPVTPLALQPYVSNVPLDVGDGVRPVSYTEPSPIHYLDSPAPTGIYTSVPQNSAHAHSPRNFGNPYGEENAGNAANANGWYPGKNLKAFVQNLTPEQKAQMQTGAAGAVSSILCNRLGIGCPTEENFVVNESGGYSYQQPIWPIIAAVAGVAVVGFGVYKLSQG